MNFDNYNFQKLLPNVLYLTKLLWKTEVQKPISYSKTLTWNTNLENLCWKTIPLSSNSQKYLLLKTMKLTKSLMHMHSCSHVLEMFENKSPLQKNIGSFMQKHKHETKLISLLKLVQIPIWSLVILFSMPINPCIN